jgi:hypothetical protein
MYKYVDRLQSLNISWCNLSEAALNVLVTSLPQKLQRLNIGGARIMTNDSEYTPTSHRHNKLRYFIGLVLEIKPMMGVKVYKY